MPKRMAGMTTAQRAASRPVKKHVALKKGPVKPSHPKVKTATPGVHKMKKITVRPNGKKATEKVMKQGVDGEEIRTNAKTKWMPFGR